MADPDDSLFGQASSRASPLRQGSLAGINSAFIAKICGSGLARDEALTGKKKRGISAALLHLPQGFTAPWSRSLPQAWLLAWLLASSPVQPFLPPVWPLAFSLRFSPQVSSLLAWPPLSLQARFLPARLASVLPPELAQGSAQALEPLELEPALELSQALASSHRPNHRTDC